MNNVATLANGSTILAQRDQLKAELASAHAAENQARLDHRRAETAITRANDARLELYKQKARGTLNGLETLNDAERAWNGARRDAISHQEQQTAARSAITAVEGEIAALHRAHLPVFAAEAEQYTRQAQDALAVLSEPYHEAWNAWQIARLAWSPLQAAITEAVVKADEEDGVYRDHTIGHRAAQVPELPLPQPGILHSLPAPRPPAMQPVAAGGEGSADNPITGDAA